MKFADRAEVEAAAVEIHSVAAAWCESRGS